MTSPRVVIIGGGPTGLGAAWRLDELGHEDWTLLEASPGFGGLASSVVDEQGFTWDLGGHVLFSHYEYFDALMDELLGEAWFSHVREAWVRMRSRWIPYPFQNNLWRLPDDEIVACVEGLAEVAAAPPARPPAHFGEWIRQSFGSGIAEVFMEPYNRKVWAHEPSRLNTAWMGDRVATVDLDRIKQNIASRRDDVGWGPNATFRFPATGGTGSIWRTAAARLPGERLVTETTVVAIDSERRVVTAADGSEWPYDALVSTIPMDELLARLRGCEPARRHRDRFVWSSSHIVGIGVEGPVPEALATKCWIYFPEPDVPFYRATVFSNYSVNNVARPGEQWSLMCEVSESPHRPVDAGAVIDDTVSGLRRAGLLAPDYDLASTWHRRLPKGYPTPFLDRDEVLAAVEPVLRQASIYSRGRFGGWKYEVSNQDHSLMQGVECIDHLLDGGEEVTYFQPHVVNGR